jgi:hypothetical protein
MMRILLFVLGFLATLTLADAQRSPSIIGPFQLTVSADHAVVQSGQHIWVRVLMKNISNGNVDCSKTYSNGINLQFRFIIHGPDGNVIAKKQVPHPELEDAASFTPCTLAQNQSTEAEDNLINRRFDMSTPGEYTIQVERGISANEKDGFVKSNKITINVTQ